MLEIKNETTATNTAGPVKYRDEAAEREFERRKAINEEAIKAANDAKMNVASAAKCTMVEQLPPYKQRFIREYRELKERYEKLKAFNNKIEAARLTSGDILNGVEMPKHDCPDHLLREQQRVMVEYLHILEIRAVIEKIDL